MHTLLHTYTHTHTTRTHEVRAVSCLSDIHLQHLHECCRLHEVPLEVSGEVLQLLDYHETEQAIQSAQSEYIHSFLVQP